MKLMMLLTIALLKPRKLYFVLKLPNSLTRQLTLSIIDSKCHLTLHIIGFTNKTLFQSMELAKILFILVKLSLYFSFNNFAKIAI